MSGNTHKRAQTRTRAHRSHSRAHTTRTITPWPRGPARGPLHGCPSEGVGVALRPSVAETQPGRECEALNGRRLPSADGGVWRAGAACVGSTRAGTARGAMAKAGGAVLAQFRGGSPRDAIGAFPGPQDSAPASIKHLFRFFLQKKGWGGAWGPTPPSGDVTTGGSGAPHTPVGRPAATPPGILRPRLASACFTPGGYTAQL